MSGSPGSLQSDRTGFDDPQPVAPEQAIPDHLLPGGHGLLIRDTLRVFSRCLQEALAEHDVSVAQWYVLRILWEQEGITQIELSQRIGVEKAGVNSLVEGMVRQGLILPRRNETDRRKVNLFLSERGWALKEVLLPCASLINTIAGEGLAEGDIAVMHRVLKAMAVNLARWQATRR
jgi:DNA-binding MarR family transcriptional regulator